MLDNMLATLLIFMRRLNLALNWNGCHGGVGQKVPLIILSNLNCFSHYHRKLCAIQIC